MARPPYGRQYSSPVLSFNFVIARATSKPDDLPPQAQAGLTAPAGPSHETIPQGELENASFESGTDKWSIPVYGARSSIESDANVTREATAHGGTTTPFTRNPPVVVPIGITNGLVALLTPLFCVPRS